MLANKSDWVGEWAEIVIPLLCDFDGTQIVPTHFMQNSHRLPFHAWNMKKY